jgi:hypothetical protein
LPGDFPGQKLQATGYLDAWLVSVEAPSPLKLTGSHLEIRISLRLKS